MKRGTSNHPKVYLLAEALKVKRPAALGYLQLLWDFTADYAPHGDVGRYPDTRIEAALDWGGRKGKLIDALVEAGWLDRHTERRLLVHDWLDHAEKSVHRRLDRETKRTQSDTPKVTPINGVTDAKIETPVRAGAPPALAVTYSHSHADTASRMYAQHQNKAGRVLFEQALSEVLSIAPDAAALAVRIERAHTAWLPHWERDGGRYAPRLDRWIRDGGFQDDPPESVPAASSHLGSMEEFRRQELGA